MNQSKNITIDNTGDNVQVLMELPKAVEVPTNIDNAHAGAVWILSVYPDIKEMVLEESQLGNSGIPTLDDLALKMAMHVAIEINTAQCGGDVREALDLMVKLWCSKQQEETILKVVEHVTVASGVLTEEELAYNCCDGGDCDIPDFENMTPQEEEEYFTNIIREANELDMHAQIADNQNCTGDPGNCPLCDAVEAYDNLPEGEDAQLPAVPKPETLGHIVDLLRLSGDSYTDAYILESILWAESKLDTERGMNYGPEDVYDYALGYLEQGGHV